MNLLQWIFGKKPKKQRPTYPGNIVGQTPSGKRVLSSSINSGGGGSSRSSDPIVTNDLLNPLNPLSPFWIGNVNNDDYGTSGNCSTPDSTPAPDDFNGFGGGTTGGGGAGGDWSSDTPSSSVDNSSSDNSSSYDSGSSSDSSSSSSDSSSFDSGSDSGSQAFKIITYICFAVISLH